tara:strand:- start:2211 stop:2372 length:162 start_codon:yes stop_codon:yes gene_type:complete
MISIHGFRNVFQGLELGCDVGLSVGEGGDEKEAKYNHFSLRQNSLLLSNSFFL